MVQALVTHRVAGIACQFAKEVTVPTGHQSILGPPPLPAQALLLDLSLAGHHYFKITRAMVEMDRFMRGLERVRHALESHAGLDYRERALAHLRRRCHRIDRTSEPTPKPALRSFPPKPGWNPPTRHIPPGNSGTSPAEPFPASGRQV